MRTKEEVLDFYPPHDWREDFEFLVRQRLSTPTDEVIPKLYERFRSKAPNHAFAKERGERLLAAWKWLIRHRDMLSARRVIVWSSSEREVPNELVNALYRHFLPISIAQLSDDVAVDSVLSMMDQERAEMRKRIESAGEN